MLSSSDLPKKVMIAAGLLGGVGLIYYVATHNCYEELDDEQEKLSKMDKALSIALQAAFPE